nr:MAG TPA: hypothetical protein [Caudoviricetes sp.]
MTVRRIACVDYCNFRHKKNQSFLLQKGPM